MQLKALLWDVDGTLADTELEGHRRAFNQAFAAAGLSWRWDEATYRQLLAISGGRERIRHYGSQVQSHPIAEAMVEDLMRAKQHAYGELARRGGLPLRPGVRRLVAEAAAQGVSQALVTTSSRSAVAALLDGHGAELRRSFGFWVCGEDVKAKKPSPEGYLQALDRLRLPASQVLAVEDSPQGLAAAQGADLPCLLTVGDQTRAGLSPWWQEAKTVINHLGETDHPAQVLKGPPNGAAEIHLQWLHTLVEEG